MLLAADIWALQSEAKSTWQQQLGERQRMQSSLQLPEGKSANTLILSFPHTELCISVVLRHQECDLLCCTGETNKELILSWGLIPFSGAQRRQITRQSRCSVDQREHHCLYYNDLSTNNRLQKCFYLYMHQNIEEGMEIYPKLGRSGKNVGTKL